MSATSADLTLLRSRVTAARRVYDLAEAELRKAHEQLRRARRALRVAMGEPDSMLEPDIATETYESGDPDV